jgi:hypothetical protein
MIHRDFIEFGAIGYKIFHFYAIFATNQEINYTFDYDGRVQNGRHIRNR